MLAVYQGIIDTYIYTYVIYDFFLLFLKNRTTAEYSIKKPRFRGFRIFPGRAE